MQQSPQTYLNLTLRKKWRDIKQVEVGQQSVDSMYELYYERNTL